MSSKFRRYFLSSLMIGMVTTPMSLSAGPSPPADTGQSTTLVLDVALDAGTLSYSRADAATSGPQRGDTYVVNGFVYPAFSVPGGDATASFTPGNDGSVGTIVITGVFMTDATALAPGDAPAMASTHVFALANGDGLITQGIDGGYPQIRALLGGTGQFSGAIGQVSEELLGTNSSGGATLRLTFQLIRLNPQDNSATSAALKQAATKQKMRAARRLR
jgi:hypothetical protein